MAKPTTREELKKYCLRRLGSDIHKIEVSDSQIEDRIDDALSKYFDYHFDGTTEEYLIVPLTDQIEADGYIDLDDKVVAVSEILPLSTSGSSSNLFDVTYQFYLNDFYRNGIIGGNLASLETMKQYLALLQQRLTPVTSYNHNRKTNRITFNENISRIRTKASHLVFKVFLNLDVDEFPNIWNDEFIKDYCTALIKLQWADNIKKYNKPMPGGVTLNYEMILTEAKEEVARLEEKLINNLGNPLGFFVG